MKKEDCFLFASVIKLHGYKGTVAVKILSAVDEKKLKKAESVFVEIHKQLVPFFIESFSFKNSEWAYIQFAGIDNEIKAREILKASIWLPSSLLPKPTGKQMLQSDITEYHVHDKVHGDLGKINRFIEMQHYPIIEVFFQEKEILIPAAEEIILKIDRKKKIIYINAPEGLIDMYLQ
jgi:16S rRNA processing protein RimM